MFDITIFGTTSVRTPERLLRLGDLPGGKPRQLLEIIALARGAVVTKPVLIDHLWSGRPPRHAIATLETYVAVLRRCLQPGVTGRDTIVRTAPGGYRLDADRVRLDLDEFDAAVSEAGRAAPAVALSMWQRAVDLARRDLLEHEPHAEWAHDARADYERRGVQAAIRGARAALDTDLLDLAASLARHAVARDPLAEDGWQALIEAHGRAGRTADAARAAAACAEALARELGVPPSALTRRLLRDALADCSTRDSRLLVAAGSR